MRLSFLRRHPLLFACVALTGCPTTLTCAEGLMFSAGVCVPRVDAGTPVDTGPMIDAPTRDAPDAPTLDAGPCGMVCTAPTPFCDETAGTCAECLMSTDCSAPTPACVAGACEQCDDNADCTTAAASACNTTTHLCEACTADTGCTHLTTTPVCDETRMTCVACTADTEVARCGPNACALSTGTCTSVARNTLDTCDTCTADSECIAGRRCVLHRFGGSDVGTFCFLDAVGGCGDTVPAFRPYRSRTDTSSVDGVAGTYCLPPATTTCAGIQDTQSTACTTDDMCGEPGVADGFCPTAGTAAGACSYECGGAFDCRSSLNCGGTPAHCRP